MAKVWAKGFEPAKTKTPQAITPNEFQGRDAFQTPNYATDLLIPFIPKHVTHIWECACGEGKISKRMAERGYGVTSTDIRRELAIYFNFLTDKHDDAFIESLRKGSAIVTNPPFSLKREFYVMCRQYRVPFALLIPADYSGWIIRACQEGAEKIIPTRRIDYITPSGKSGTTGHTADFHSMWLTWGFELGKTETFVELSIKEKKENI